jgi:hypothetical protein
MVITMRSSLKGMSTVQLFIAAVIIGINMDPGSNETPVLVGAVSLPSSSSFSRQLIRLLSPMLYLTRLVLAQPFSVHPLLSPSLAVSVCLSLSLSVSVFSLSRSVPLHRALSNCLSNH